MSESIDAAKPTSNLPGYGRSVAYGLALSVITSLVAIFIAFVLALIVDVSINSPHGGFTARLQTLASFFSGSVDDVLFRFTVLFLFVILLELFALVPVALGGGLLGFIMQHLAYHHHLNRWSTVILGAVVGLGVGLVAESVLISNIRYEAMAVSSERAPLFTGTIGIAWGALTSLLLLAWFKRKMT